MDQRIRNYNKVYMVVLFYSINDSVVTWAVKALTRPCRLIKNPFLVLCLKYVLNVIHVYLLRVIISNIITVTAFYVWQGLILYIYLSEFTVKILAEDEKVLETALSSHLSMKTWKTEDGEDNSLPSRVNCLHFFRGGSKMI